MAPEEFIKSFEDEKEHLEDEYDIGIDIRFDKSIEAYRVRVSKGYFSIESYIGKLFISETGNDIVALRIVVLSTIKKFYHTYCGTGKENEHEDDY